MELVSIVVPVYNVEKYIRRCVDSIINQSYKNLEIILVDDGSKDNSGKICDEYKDIDSRIVSVHKTNGGLSDARNYGINRATGNFIAFIDSDDYVNPKFIETLYRNLVETDSDISIVSYRKVFNEEPMEHIKCSEESEINRRVFTSLESLQALFNDETKYQFTIAWSKLYKRYIFDHVSFPKGRNYEDTATAPKILSQANRVVYQYVPLYYYYMRMDSITKSDQYVKNDIIEAVKDCRNFYLEHEYPNLFIKAEETYLATLMGVHARCFSRTNHTMIREKKKYIYNTVREEFRTYRQQMGRTTYLKCRLFLIAPTLYKHLIKIKK